MVQTVGELTLQGKSIGVNIGSTEQGTTLGNLSILHS